MKHLSLLLTLLGLLTFTSCSDLFGDDEDKSIIPSDTLNLTGGEIVEPQGRPWIIASALIDGSVHIKSGAVLHLPSAPIRIKNGTLTIDSGAVLKFGTDSYLEVYSQGNIIATGTATAPVTFTNLNTGTFWGYNSTPVGSGGIYIEEGAATNNSLTGVVVSNAKVGVLAQQIDGLTIASSTFSTNQYWGIVLQDNSLTSLSSSSFIANGTNDIYVQNGVLTKIATDNQLSKAIQVESGATETGGTIPAYTYLFDGSFFIKGNGTGVPTPVIFSAGAVCQFMNDSYIEVNKGGQIQVLGTTESPVTFTNAEANKYWGYSTDGGGIWIENEAATGNTFSHAYILNAQTGIQSDEPNSLTINNSQFKNCKNWGLAIENNALVSMTQCTFSGNGINDLYAKSGVITKIGTDNSFEKAIQVESGAKELSGTIQPYKYQIDGAFNIEAISATPTPVTILPGAHLSFMNGAYIEIDKGGQLIAKGTSSAPITFDNAEPGKFWGYVSSPTGCGSIFIEDDAAVGNEFDYIVIDRANVGINNDVPNSFTLTNSTISEYQYYGIVSMPNSNDIITTNTIASTVLTAVNSVHFED